MDIITTTATRELSGFPGGGSLPVAGGLDRGVGFGSATTAVRPLATVPSTETHNSMIAADTVRAIAYVAAKPAAPPRGEPR